MISNKGSSRKSTRRARFDSIIIFLFHIYNIPPARSIFRELIKLDYRLFRRRQQLLLRAGPCARTQRQYGRRVLGSTQVPGRQLSRPKAAP